MKFTEEARKQFVLDVYSGMSAADLRRTYGCSRHTAAEYRRLIRSGRMRYAPWQKAIAEATNGSLSDRFGEAIARDFLTNESTTATADLFAGAIARRDPHVGLVRKMWRFLW